MVKFKANIRQLANSHVVTIPSAYINNKIVMPGQTYWFDILKEEEQNETTP